MQPDSRADLQTSAAPHPTNRSISLVLRYGLLLFVALTLLPTALTLIWLSFQAQQQQLAEVQHERSRAAAGEIDSYIDDLQRKLSYLGRIRGLADESHDVQLRLLDALSRHDTAYETLAIVDKQGRVLTSVSPYGLNLGPGVAALPEFRRALDNGEEVISQVSIDPQTHLSLVTFGVPIRDKQDAVAGVLLAQVNLEFLWFVVSRTTVGETGYVYVLDQRNQLIADRASAPKTFQLQDVSDRTFVRQLTAPQAQHMGSYVGLHGEEVLGAAARVPSTGWHVVVELPTAEARAPLHQLLRVMGAALLVAFVLAMLSGIVLVRRVVRPLRLLTDAAARLSTGDLDTQVIVARHDELGLLAATFNQMTARLRYLFGALHESQRRFQAIFDQTFQFMGLLTPDGRVLEINQTALDFGGLRREAVIDRFFWEQSGWSFAPLAREHLRAAVAEAAQGIFVRFEAELYDKQGASRIIDFSLKPLRDEQGQVVLLIPEGRDITEHKQLEVLHADLKFSRSISAATPDLIYVYDLVLNRNVYVNRAQVPLLNLPASEVEGMGDQLLKQIMHPDDLASMPAHVDRLLALADGVVSEREYRLRKEHGGWRWVLGREVVFARDAMGRPSQVLGVVQDVSARRQAAETMQLLAEVGELLGSSLDYEVTVAGLARLVVPRFADFCTVHLRVDDGTFNEIAVAHRNPAFVAKIHELTRCYPLDPDAALGLPQVVRSGQVELVPQIENQRLEMFAQSAEHLQLLQELQPASSICAPLLARGRTIGAISFYLSEASRRYAAEDLPVAEQLAARTALAIDNGRLYREAQSAVQAREQFLSIASHELKTPLTSMIGYTELLRRRAEREGGMNERDLRAVHVIGEQAARLSKMVTSLLDLSRIQMGQLTIDPQPVDVGALLRRAIEDFEPTLEAHQIVLHCPLEPLIIEGDELRLFQVLQNMLGNAIKYSPHGGLVEVRAERCGDQVCIALSDQGIGIPSGALPNLFSRFYRAPNGEQEQIAGMGLGLYVVKEIVSMHQGTVDVQSREGYGSTFTIRLPLSNLPLALEAGAAGAAST